MLFNLIFGETYSARRAYLLLLLLLLPVVLFLTNSPVWDDPFIFEGHAHWTVQALLGPYMANKSSYWRPLTVWMIAIPNLLGVSIWTNKLISLALFFAQGCLAIATLDVLLKSKKSALDGMPLIALAALFALHPIFVESAMWISARADLLVGLFVMLAVYWLTCQYTRAQLGSMPPAPLSGALSGFAITALTCASKDTGIVWSGLAMMTVAFFGVRSVTGWRRYWLSSAIGIVVALLGFYSLRIAVLGQLTGLSQIAGRHVVNQSDRLQYFAEFLFRAATNIFLPFADPAPFKSGGWFATWSTLALIALIVVTFAVTAILLLRLYRKNKVCASLSISALAMVVFHAALAMFSEPTIGTVLSDRYVAPSAALLYLALALYLVLGKPATSRFPFNASAMAAIALLVLQSLLLWTETRFCWTNNVALWDTTFKHDNSSIIVAENYSAARYHEHDYLAARNIARDWIERSQQGPAAADQCNIFVQVLETDLNLNDRADGIHYAVRALPIGWCHPKMARNIAQFLMQDHCDQVLTMLHRTLDEGDKPKELAAWQYKNAEQKDLLLANTAYAEARCGDIAKANDFLTVLAKSSPDWAPGGTKGRALMQSARAGL